ncbi:MAG: hypothetical protein NTY09_12630 [bacterium]|nr:hypothetical protein [bacterium]
MLDKLTDTEISVYRSIFKLKLVFYCSFLMSIGIFLYTLYVIIENGKPYSEQPAIYYFVLFISFFGLNYFKDFLRPSISTNEMARFISASINSLKERDKLKVFNEISEELIYHHPNTVIGNLVKIGYPKIRIHYYVWFTYIVMLAKEMPVFGKPNYDNLMKRLEHYKIDNNSVMLIIHSIEKIYKAAGGRQSADAKLWLNVVKLLIVIFICAIIVTWLYRIGSIGYIILKIRELTK